MSVLFICSEPDLPSVNMREELLGKGGWEESDAGEGRTLHRRGDDCILSVPGLHIRLDGIDATAADLGFEADAVVFMSRHASASGAPSLTVHPIGNYNDNRLGGRERELVPAAPGLMGDALRRIAAARPLPGFTVCYEVTHHGPWLETPTFFIEIGSDERNWGNRDAARLLAAAMDGMRSADHPAAVGIGGGHYAPRFTEVALEYALDFGHMVPGYQLEGRDDEDILRMIGDAARMSGTECVYMHRNSLKKPLQRRVAELVDTAGYEVLRSADLEPLSSVPANR